MSIVDPESDHDKKSDWNEYGLSDDSDESDDEENDNESDYDSNYI